ncbi:MAG: nucleotidyl transferase AbiEii/AbiGii toxin family protein [Pseudobdellovibrionaceae bacterium]
MLLYEIVDAFDSAKLKYAIVGGYALALHGLVRATMDVDLVVNLKQSDFEMSEKVLEKIGLRSRLPVRAQDIIKMRNEYIQNRNLIAWSFVDYSDPSRQVDILITKDLRDLKCEKISVGGKKINVASLQEILKMKIEAGRDQDLVDIKNIREKINEKKKKK